MDKVREFQKNIYFCFIDYAKAFDCVDHNKLWKILKEMGIPGHLTCLLKNPYAGQEATVRTEHETTDPFILLDAELAGCHNNEDHGFGFAMVTKRFLLTFGKKKKKTGMLV